MKCHLERYGICQTEIQQGMFCDLHATEFAVEAHRRGLQTYAEPFDLEEEDVEQISPPLKQKKLNHQLY
ncbi:MAG: hypothetical protein G01um101470_491 [Parcubacteria group bacterium Gr01-1014_70]|nr:MAG: hypothetical protein G01um101470_491 [Parcubacteria group bacterium Gr01-1014_70]